SYSGKSSIHGCGQGQDDGQHVAHRTRWHLLDNLIFTGIFEASTACELTLCDCDRFKKTKSKNRPKASCISILLGVLKEHD
uniref:Uncharacterized protein n=1 Tax=Sus scrofa TaxID=9823 RepID=A0A8D1YW53_PIG